MLIKRIFAAAGLMNENDGAGNDTGGSAADYNASRGDFVAEQQESTPAPAEKAAEPTPPAEEPEAEKAEKTTPPTEEAEKDDVRIPKARFDEAIAAEREKNARLVEQLEQLRRGQQAQQQVEQLTDLEARLNEKRAAYEDAIFEGDKAQAQALRSEIAKLERAVYTGQAEQLAAKQVEEYRAQLEYDSAVARIEADFPMLNPDHESYSEALSAQVLDLMGAFVTAGKPQKDAMAEAVDLITRANGIQAASRTPAPPAPPAEKTEAEKAAERIAMAQEAARNAEKASKATSVARNVSAAALQPPNLADIGADADMAGMNKNADVSRMTDKQFEAFMKDETAVRVARGDLV